MTWKVWVTSATYKWKISLRARAAFPDDQVEIVNHLAWSWIPRIMEVITYWCQPAVDDVAVLVSFSYLCLISCWRAQTWCRGTAPGKWVHRLSSWWSQGLGRAAATGTRTCEGHIRRMQMSVCCVWFKWAPEPMRFAIIRNACLSVKISIIMTKLLFHWVCLLRNMPLMCSALFNNFNHGLLCAFILKGHISIMPEDFPKWSSLTSSIRLRKSIKGHLKLAKSYSSGHTVWVWTHPGGTVKLQRSLMHLFSSHQDCWMTSLGHIRRHMCPVLLLRRVKGLRVLEMG